MNIYLKKYTLILMTAASFSMFLSGCNTVEGVGTDIQQAGRAIKNSAAESR